MATREQVLAAVLRATGNPVSGVMRDAVDDIVDAVVALDEPEAKSFSPVKETRVVRPGEVR